MSTIGNTIKEVNTKPNNEPLINNTNNNSTNLENKNTGIKKYTISYTKNLNNEHYFSKDGLDRLTYNGCHINFDF